MIQKSASDEPFEACTGIGGQNKLNEIRSLNFVGRNGTPFAL